ncbi:MAG: ATP-binding protein [Solidesulfovibrio sp. DCME]|uniref:ATP-binding protein n=1 Tax=Solidesulfovibrio sp. DCME TaxID=3447380 RepID=UPI003D0B45BC
MLPHAFQLVRNALEAAAVDSGANAVTVDLRATTAEAIIRIHNGLAIPRESVKDSTKKYATSGKPGGTGPGAYSARLAAQAHGGNIAWETSEADGTLVTVHLPLSRQPLQQRTVGEPGSRTRKRICITEPYPVRCGPDPLTRLGGGLVVALTGPPRAACFP